MTKSELAKRRYKAKQRAIRLENFRRRTGLSPKMFEAMAYRPGREGIDLVFDPLKCLVYSLVDLAKNHDDPIKRKDRIQAMTYHLDNLRKTLFVLFPGMGHWWIDELGKWQKEEWFTEQALQQIPEPV